VPIPNATLSLVGNRRGTGWKGELSVDAAPLKAYAPFEFDPRTQFIELPSVQIDGPNSHVSGHLSTITSLNLFEGEINVAIRDLKQYRFLLSDSQLRGSLSANIQLQSTLSKQQFSCLLDGDNLCYKDISCENLHLNSYLLDLFGKGEGELRVDGSSINLPQLSLDHAAFKTAVGPGASPFTLYAQGNFKDPLQISTSGTWEKKKEELRLEVNDLHGQSLKKPFHLEEPFKVIWSPERFKVCHLALLLAEGSLHARVDLSPNSSLVKVKGKEFPIDFASLFRPDLSMEGISDFQADVVSWENIIEGSLNLTLKRAELGAAGLKSKGSLQVHLSKNLAQIHGDLIASGGQSLSLSGSFPFFYSHYPFSIKPCRTKPFTAQVSSEGKLEDLFDFINIGAHRVEGWLSTRLLLSGTLEKPNLQGPLELQDGLYTNHYTGTHLENIQAKAQANKQTIAITSLTAQDASGEGSATATGHLLVDPHRKFPFTINAKLSDLQTVSFDTITGRFGGELQISGDTDSATARGNLTVSRANFHIPDTLPEDIPELPITFINVPEVLERGRLPTPKLYPFYLDLNVKAPGGAFVEGKGVSCELRGDLHLTGTYTDIAANGSLHLVMGEFLFSGKVFSLTEGEIIFRALPHPSAYLSITGSCALPDVTARVILRGPLSSPSLSFQSSPQLPLSSLLSQILFNKDLSEVSAIQAIQIAQTVLSLSSGNAPDMLSKVRKTLGIDRLTVGASEHDPTRLSLQIGKYVIPGVMLSWTQGATSHNLSVEVDLKKGFFAQAEVDELQQGKFSLRWHHHY
jgi:translocation and assembly module TamB